MTDESNKTPKRPGAFSREWTPEAESIVRPHNYSKEGEGTRILQTVGACRDTQKILLFVDAWNLSDDHARPNWTITINLPSPIVFPESCKNRTVHHYLLQNLLNPVGTALKTKSLPWRWISVVEVKGGNYHVHALAHFPSRRTFLDAFFRVWKKVAETELQVRATFEECVFQRSSGTPIYATPVDPDRQYEGTGRKGVDGYADYMVKNLGKMTRRRSFCQEIGSPIIISQQVNQLVATKSFRVRSVKYSPASSGVQNVPGAE